MKKQGTIRRKVGGFTLVELMVVIAILGVLATFVAVRFVGQADKARVEMAKIQINTFENALQHFYYDKNRYPRTDEGLEILAKENYLEKDFVPKDPWGRSYAYYWGDIDPNKYTIICYGKDGKPGGNEYDADITNHTIEADMRKGAEN